MSQPGVSNERGEEELPSWTHRPCCSTEIAVDEQKNRWFFCMDKFHINIFLHVPHQEVRRSANGEKEEREKSSTSNEQMWEFFFPAKECGDGRRNS